MQEALKEAALAFEAGEVPAGAILAAPSGLIMGRGRNQVISLSDPTAHAEIQALRAGAEAVKNYRLSGLWLFSTLEPCPMCLTAAIHSRVAKIYFGAAEPKWGAAGSLIDLLSWPGLNHYPMVAGGLLADQSRQLMVDFFKERRRNAPKAN